MEEENLRISRNNWSLKFDLHRTVNKSSLREIHEDSHIEKRRIERLVPRMSKLVWPHQHFVSLRSVAQPAWGPTRWRRWVQGMKFACRKQFFSFLNLSLPPSPFSDRPMRPATRRTFDLLPSTSPGQSFCTDRKNLHCHFSYGPIIAEPRLDVGFCGSWLR